MPLPKRVLYYGLLAALTLIAIEGLARLAYFMAFAEWYGGQPAVEAADIPPPPPPRQNEPWRRFHPFHGISAAEPVHDLNVMPPWPQREDVALIGLFGGSVAQEVTPAFRRALARYFSANNLIRRPVVLEMGHATMQQPQQVMIAANALLLGGHFDLIVNLDGYNEMANPLAGYQRGSYPWFPRYWDFRLNLTAAEYRLVGRIGVLREKRAELSRAAAAHPLRHTAVYGIVHRYRRERTGRQIIQLNRQLAASWSAYSLERGGPRQWFPQERELYPAATRMWYRSSRLLSELAAVAGAEYYHFLQPNQYVPGGKPLSAAELACCYNAGGTRERIYQDLYPNMVQFGEKLSRRPVNYFDLSYIFRGNRETLYRDDCCHFNDRGNELLAVAMVERMAPALQRASTAAAPPSGLAAAARPEPEQLLIDAHWQVYRRGRYWLVYGNDGCTPEDRAAWFFLHIVPVNRSDLPAIRREHGFDNQDFRFDNSNGGVTNGRCVVERRLPGYPIADIRTGQYIYGGDKLWEGEYRFVE